MKYAVAGKIFVSFDEACSYASFIFKVSRIVVAVEELKQ